MKAMKKVLAFVLALAMVVTAVPITNAAAKTANLSAGKTVNKSYYTGKTHTLKLTGVTKADVKKTTWKSSNAKVVKIVADSQTKVSAKFKCVKKGTATVTATVTLKNGKTKTYKAKITVKAPTLTVSPSAVNLTVGQTQAITVKKTPSGAKLTYSSSDPGVASISGKKITAHSAGKATITVQLTNGTKKLTKKVDVTVSAAVDGLTATLTNPFTADYPNTVLVGQNAMISVACIQNGKPVAGKSIVMSIDRNHDDAVGAGNYEVVNPQRDTDENGIATFVIRNWRTTNIKITDTSEIANLPYVVQVQGDNQTITAGSVAFAAYYVKPVTVKSTTNDTLKAGQNFTGASAVVNTADMADPTHANDQYVMSQQVSADGTNHAVTFQGGYPMLTWPRGAGDETSAEKMTDPVNFDSGAYHVYNNASNATTTLYYTLKESFDKLTYATMHFSDLKLSAHTRLVIEAYANEADAKASTPEEPKNRKAQHIVNGESSQTKFDYQIPKDETIRCVKVYIESEGQVDLDMNSGYKVSGVTYVYKKNVVGLDGIDVPVKNAVTTWSIVETPFTNENVIVSADAADVTRNIYGKNITVVRGGKLTEKLPAFPYTGTAVLTNYDANGNVTNYYAVETVNNTKNQNVATGTRVYEINADELRDKVGELTPNADGSEVTVDSKASGRSTLEGTITINGQKIDAEYASVYTSVLWNPIPNAADADNSQGFVALLGQNIEVIAQLTDRNGNSVTRAGEQIIFSYANAANNGTLTTIAAGTPSLNAFIMGGGSQNDAKVVDLATTTDKNGQGKITLTASSVRLIQDLQAVCQNRDYNVKLMIKNQATGAYVEPAVADLYWVDANLQFVTSAIDGEKKEIATTADAPRKETGVNDITPKAGSNWEYGVKLSGTWLNDGYGVLGHSMVGVEGLDVQMTKAAGSVGTVTVDANVKNRVTATSKQAGKTQIVSRIDAKSVTAQTKTVWSGIYAGTGQTSINKRLTLNVQWMQNGIKAEFVTPNGVNIYDVDDAADSIAVYVKVTDAFGNPLANTQVDFTKDTPDAQVTFSAATVNTDANGVAKTTMTQVVNTTNVITTVSAKVVGLGSSVVKAYRWVQPNNAETMMINDGRDDNGAFVTNYNNDTGVITLTFTSDIVATSLQKEMVKAWYDKNSDENETMEEGSTDVTQFTIKDVAVNNNVVTITVNNKIGTIDARGYVKVTIENAYVPVNDSIAYTMTSEDGMQYEDPGVTFTIGINSNVSGIEVKESVHAKGLAAAVAESLKNEVVAELGTKTVADGADTMTLEGLIDGDIIGMGAIGQAQVTWTSSNTNVMTVTPNERIQRVGATTEGAVTTSGAAISYTGTAVGAGITLLTASLQAYTSQDGEWVPTGDAQELKFIVTADANGFVSMVKCVEDANGEVPQTEATAIGGKIFGNAKLGLINFDRTSSASGIPAINEAADLWGKFTVSSTNEQLINLTFGALNDWGNPTGCTLTTAGTGTATLTIKVEHAYSGQGRDFTLIYDVDVTDGVATYKRLEIKAV